MERRSARDALGCSRKATRSRSAHTNRTLAQQKTIVRLRASCLNSPANLLFPGFIYRHLAAGPPVEGLYAHYDITEELGKGSFATVMKAMCKENGHWYAVKMIQTKNLKRSMTKHHANGDRVTVDASIALHKEVQILQKLQHPNICQLKEVFYEENYVRECCAPACGTSC